MCNYWANFIKDGDPNGTDFDGKPMPEWKPYHEGDPAAMFFHEDREKVGMITQEPDELMKIYIENILGNDAAAQ